MYSPPHAGSDGLNKLSASQPSAFYSSQRGGQPEFITQSAEVRRLLAQADRVADSPATVLITGEAVRVRRCWPDGYTGAAPGVMPLL